MLRLCIMVDDTANIFLNGNPIGTAFSQHSETTFDWNTGFIIGGLNTLEVEVINNPCYYMGFDLKGWVCCGDAIPVTYCGDTICDWNDPARFGNRISTYSCPITPITDNGPEAVFTFNLTVSSVVTAELITGPAFFDIFILDTYPAGPVQACGTSTSPAIAFLAPGTYFIVVDSPNWDDIDQFCFTIECEDPCDDVSVSYQRLDSCCYDIYLDNASTSIDFYQIRFTTESGLNTILEPSGLPTGWTYSPSPFPLSSNYLDIYTNTSGSFSEFFKLCLEIKSSENF